MKLVKNFLKLDLLYLFILMLLFIFINKLFWAHLSNPIIDVGREAFFPAEILKGKILYKDIFNIFFPLSYQLNALLFLIFGQSLTTLYFAGSVNAIIIVFTIYLISRLFLKGYMSFAVTFLIMTSCIFVWNFFNYIYPYSFAMVYALSTFLLSVLFLAYYLKISDPKFAVWAFFFAGTSLLFKYEFWAYFILLIIIMVFIKPVSKKYIVYSILFSSILPIISWGVLFYQGLTLADLTSHMQLMSKFSRAPSYLYLLYNLAGTFINIELIKNGFMILGKFYCLFAGVFAILYIFLFVCNKFTGLLKSKSVSIKLLDVLIVTAALILTLLVINFFVLQHYALDKLNLNKIFFFTPFCTTLILLFVLFDRTKHNKSNLNFEVYTFVIIASLLGTIKSYFFINVNSNAAYFFPLLLVVNVVFLAIYLPEKFKFLNNKTFQQFCFIVIIILALLFLKRNLALTSALYNPIKIKNNILYTEEAYSTPINMAVQYIQENIPQNSSILMVPEGVILNFLTDRPTFNKYYALIPNHIETFGEEDIIRNLEKNPPDYIFLNNRLTADYNKPLFGKDYGVKIYNYIIKNYKYETQFISNSQDIMFKLKFCIKVYKKNSARSPNQKI